MLSYEQCHGLLGHLAATDNQGQSTVKASKYSLTWYSSTPSTFPLRAAVKGNERLFSDRCSKPNETHPRTMQ